MVRIRCRFVVLLAFGVAMLCRHATCTLEIKHTANKPNPTGYRAANHEYSQDHSIIRDSASTSLESYSLRQDAATTSITSSAKGERVTRMIIYMIGAGFFIDLGIFFARFNRASESHDEFHAALMVLSIFSGLAMDIWWVIRELGNMFKGNSDVDTYSIFVIAFAALSIPIMIFGALVRSKMRDPKNKGDYHTFRRLHKAAGITLWLVVKAKLYFLARLEDASQVLYQAESQFRFQLGFFIYAGVLLACWIIIFVVFQVMQDKFRNKILPDNTGEFSTAQTQVHKYLLESQSDLMVQSSSLGMYKDIIWVSYEDRVFDVSDLDHPGGRFITKTLQGQEISRFLSGKLEYSGTDANRSIRHHHSSRALNLLEDKFIGFLKIPKVIDRYEIEDTDETVMSTRRLVKIKDEQRLKLKNDNYLYDFSAAESADISDSFSRLLLHSSKAKISITENLFLIAGKYFNVRVAGSKDPQPYNVVLSQSPSFKRIKHSLISNFLAEFPTFRAESAIGPEKIVESVEQVLLTVHKNEFRKKSVDNSREDHIEAPGFTKSRVVPDLMDEYLPICFKTLDVQAKAILDIPRNKSALDVRGPFGPGLGVTRYSFGHNLLFAQGSASLALADFIDFVLRYYIYMYSIKKSARNTSQQYKDSVNPFEDDFEYTFNNKPQFVIYLALKTPSDFEGLFAADLHLITQIEQELKLGVVNNVVVRLPAPPASYSGKYPGIRFETGKTTGKDFEKFLTAAGLAREDLAKKVERAVAIGHQSFVKEVREGLTTHGLPHEKFKSL